MHFIPEVPIHFIRQWVGAASVQANKRSLYVRSCHSNAAFKLSFLQMEGLAQGTVNYFPPNNFHKFLNSHLNNQRNILGGFLTSYLLYMVASQSWYKPDIYIMLQYLCFSLVWWNLCFKISVACSSAEILSHFPLLVSSVAMHGRIICQNI